VQAFDIRHSVLVRITHWINARLLSASFSPESRSFWLTHVCIGVDRWYRDSLPCRFAASFHAHRAIRLGAVASFPLCLGVRVEWPPYLAYGCDRHFRRT
jgi:hypothetical protein